VRQVNEAEWFRAEIEATFGDGAQSSLARFMVLAGDTRHYETILRSINNAARGANKVSGEMRVILALLRYDRKQVDKWVREACEKS